MKLHIHFEIENIISSEVLEKHSSDLFEVIQDNTINIVCKQVKENEQSLEKLRMIAGEAAKLAKKYSTDFAVINEKALQKAFESLHDKEIISAFVEGWTLGAYAFDTYKSKKSNSTVPLQFQDESAIDKEISRGQIRAAATAFSRDLTNEIPSTLTPETFPEVLNKAFDNSNVEITVHDKAALETMKMNGILTVNRGSKFNPALIELHYQGDSTKPLVVLVGKGVTFDTGGISLKGGRNISDMRMDMGGAAAVAGAVKLLAESNADVNVIGLIQTVENTPSKDAVLPGDVITYKNGHTVQIGNTDAEGRLILADGLIRAGELNAEYIVDIATLTGSIERALGQKLAGVFGDDNLMSTMKTIGDINGDRVWPMPLVEEYEKTLHSDYADFCNISNMGPAGAIVAALFLRKFVPENSKWLHVDMAGVMESKNEGYYTSAASGYGARLLADYAVEISK